MSVASIGSGSYQATLIFANYQQRGRSLKSVAGNNTSEAPAEAQGTASSSRQDFRDAARSRATTGIDLTNLAKALDAGDLAGARTALAAIQQVTTPDTESASALTASGSVDTHTFRLTA